MPHEITVLAPPGPAEDPPHYLVVSNLDTSFSPAETKLALYCVFARFGPPEPRVVMLWDRREHRGRAWIEFPPTLGERAQEALLKMNGVAVLGAAIHVRVAPNGPPADESMSRKRRRDTATVVNYVPAAAPTTALLLVRAPLFWAETVLRTLPGYESSTACGRAKAAFPTVLVKFATTAQATKAYDAVVGARPLGTPLRVYFATVRSARTRYARFER